MRGNMDLNKNTQADEKSSQTGGSGALSYDDIIDKDILELMGAKDMTPEEKEETYKKMLETIQNRVFARIGDVIKDEDVEEMRKAIEKGDKTEYLTFLKSKGVNLEKIYAEEALIYKIEMVDLINSRSGDGAKRK
jgi:hypothetical protein